MTDLRGIAIGIPANDEARRIERALSSVLASARGHLPVVVVVAADACRDRTAAIATERLRDLPPNVEAHVVEIDAHRAGVARERARREADERLRLRTGDHAPRWIATTDADSVVPLDWLSGHVRWHERGADAIAGLVEVHPADHLAPAVRRHLDRERALAGVDHSHVFGANFGVTAQWWDRVGGFPRVAVGEDALLVQRLRDAGARVIGVPDSVVTTSGRLLPRAPRGFGATLATLTRDVERF